MNDKALQLVPTERAIAPISIADVKLMADAVAESGLYPSIRTPQAAFTLMMLCQSEGLHPVQALRRYDIIDGKPALKTDAMLADFQKLGGRIDWLKNTETEVTGKFTRPGGESITVTWTMEDAKRAKLAGKNNWVSYPRQMLKARVISEAIKLIAPAINTGMYAPEEVMDFAPSLVPAPVASTTGATRDGRFAIEADDVEYVDENILEMVDIFDINTGEAIRKEAKLSERQLKEIDSLSHQLRNNLGPEKFRKRLIRTFNKEMAQFLSAREAAHLIDSLLRAVNKQEAKLEAAGHGALAPEFPQTPADGETNE